MVDITDDETEALGIGVATGKISKQQAAEFFRNQPGAGSGAMI